MHNRTVKHYLLFIASFLLLTFSRIGAQPIMEMGGNQKSPEEIRIVSLSPPNVTETLYALDVGAYLVGRSDYCNYPEQVMELPSVGTLYNPNLETLLSLEPTVVISSAFVSEDFLSSVERAGIKVIQLETQQTFQGTYELIREIAEVVGKQSEAELMILSMQNTVREVVSTYQNKEKPSVYMVIDFGGFDGTATGDTFLGEMIELAGATNVAKSAKNWTYSKELLMAADPEILLLNPPRWGGESAEATIQEFTTTKPYSDLTGEIITFDADSTSRQGPRSADALKALAELIHQEKK